MRCILVISLLLTGCPSSTPPTDGGPDAWLTYEDSDGDGINDGFEGRDTGLDTDADGTPDYLDDDSDGDGILDADEDGDEYRPRDTDGDLTPDFQDLDSDGNGIPDSDEWSSDFDGDGLPDSHDMDDDNDFVEWPQEPGDANGDGLTDDHDPDLDDDLIMDGDEFGADTDGDGTEDRLDLDSDDDGLTDRYEGGDADVFSPPIDSDGDAVPDFRDSDSDNDGLTDAEERELGTSTTMRDSDGDGVDDLIEVAAGTDPLDSTESPRTRGDFVFVVGFMDSPDPADFVFSRTLSDVLLPVPSAVHLRFTPDDPETAGFFGGLVATTESSECTATLTPTTVLEPDDGFVTVSAFETPCWRVRAAQNDTVPAISERPQVFEGTLGVYVDGGVVPVMQVPLYFLIPPMVGLGGP